MRKLEKTDYVIIVLSIGLVLVITVRLGLFQVEEGLVNEEILKNREAWMESATENLNADFLVIGGRNYFLARGKLVSNCTEFDPYSHCPISIRSASAGGGKIFVNSLVFTKPAAGVFPYPLTEGVRFLAFPEKRQYENVSVEFEILDYIPNADLCERPQINTTLCSIIWTKNVFSGSVIKADDGVSIEIKDFDYSSSGGILTVSLKVEAISEGEPNATLAFYRNLGKMKFMLKEIVPGVDEGGGTYSFGFNEVVEITNEPKISALLLVVGGNSFYAKEWLFDDGNLVNSIVYD